MGWFTRPDPAKVINALSDMCLLLDKRVTSLEIAVDGFKLRMQKKMFPKVDPEEAAAQSSPPSIEDGFDELRKLNKDATSK